MSNSSFLAILTELHAQTHADLQKVLTNNAVERMRARPHRDMNSMIWSAWHSFRCEDATISRFVAPLEQVFTTQHFLTRMGVPFSGDGYGMTSDDVTTLSNEIVVAELIVYGHAVQAQSAAAIAQMQDWDFATPLAESQIRQVCTTYADLANDDVQSTVNYAVSMSKATYIMKHYYGHSQYHLGEISAIDGQIAGKRYFTW
ncbi:MAG: DinB family protein [Chloroflexales bacterium]|nr:DinB family protein [Chloroflexales bacterium]